MPIDKHPNHPPTIQSPTPSRQAYYYVPLLSSSYPPKPMPLPPASHGPQQLLIYDPAAHQHQPEGSTTQQQQQDNPTDRPLPLQPEQSRTPLLNPRIQSPKATPQQGDNPTQTQGPSSPTATGSTQHPDISYRITQVANDPPVGMNVDNSVLKASGDALLPAQALLENFWQITVQRVQSELIKLSNEFSGILEAEKATQKKLQQACERLRHAKRADRSVWATEKRRMKAAYDDLADVMTSVKAVNENLIAEIEDVRGREKALAVEVGLMSEELGIMKSLQSETGCKYPPDLLETVRALYRPELEARVGKLLSDAHRGRARQSTSEKRPPLALDRLVGYSFCPRQGSPQSDNQSGAGPSRLLPAPQIAVDHGKHHSRMAARPDIIDLCSEPSTSSPISTPSLPTPLELVYNTFRSPKKAKPPPLISPGLRNMMGGLELEPRRISGGEGGGGDEEERRLLKRTRAEFDKDFEEVDRRNGRGMEVDSGRRVSGVGGRGDVKMAVDRESSVSAAGVGGVVEELRKEQGLPMSENVQVVKRKEVAPSRQSSPMDTSPTSKTQALPQDSDHGSIRINRMDLIYVLEHGKITCKMCLARRRSGSAIEPAVTFSAEASWEDLIRHCRAEHPEACENLERLILRK